MKNLIVAALAAASIITFGAAVSADTTFTDNKAEHGGAIYFEGGSNIDTTFTSNKAENGGAIFYVP